MYWPEIFLGPGNTALREIYSLPAGPVRQNPVVYLPAGPAGRAARRIPCRTGPAGIERGGEQLRAQVSIHYTAEQSARWVDRDKMADQCC